MKTRELKTVGTVLQELMLSYGETLEVAKGLAKDLRYIKSLRRDGDKSKLVKIGLALIAFPEPTPISETLGVFALSLGVIQNKIKKSTLHIEDIYETFQDVNRNLLNALRAL